MCGICGIFGPSGKDRMIESARAMLHRGPDDEGYYFDSGVSLGFRRLSIIDLETGNQPISNEDKTVWLVTNGEIYNYSWLREDLIAKGHKFYTRSDAEVIVHLYEDMKEECFGLLNGIFAIALYDRKKNRIILARDRFGVKPLYYTMHKNRLYFASEIKSIISNSEIKKELSEEALFHYMTFRYVPTPHTIYKGIYALRPAHTLIFDGKTSSEAVYWQLSLNEELKMNEEDAVDELLYRLENAVKLQLRSDVPVGSFLSGGLDSSLITAFAKKHYPGRLSTFTLAYSGDLADKEEDARFSKLLSRQWQTEHHIRRISPEDYLKNINKITWHFDQPFSHGYSPFFISEAMKGWVKVAISGDGADEIFGSYFTHRIARPLYNYARYAKDGEIDAELLYPCEKDRELIKRLAGLGDSECRMELYNMYSDENKKAVFNPDMLRKMKSYSSKEYIKNIFNGITTGDPQNRIQEYELKTLLVDQIFEFNDKLTMANSIECRVPYLENDFFSFAASIPGRLRINGRTTKYILKKAASRILPAEIVNRPPVGFQLPTNMWMRKELKDDITDTLSGERIEEHDLFNSAHIQGLLRDFYERGDESPVYKIWNFYCFQKWYDSSFLGRQA